MVNREHRRVRQAARLPTFQFTDWHHHVVTTRAKQKIATLQAVKAMGWSSPKMLKVYLELAGGDVADAFGTGRQGQPDNVVELKIKGKKQ